MRRGYDAARQRAVQVCCVDPWTMTAPSASSMAGVIFDIQRFSIHDGPGIRTTVFFKGCPLKCWWCHNPESQARNPELLLRPNRCISCGACVLACAEGAARWDEGNIVTDRATCVRCGACAQVCSTEARMIVGRTMTVTQIMTEVQRDVLFFDQSGGGVTFSGGEPLAHPDFLEALLLASKAEGLHTAVDTCGFASWAVCDRVRQHTDLFLYDLKLIDDARHRRYCGAANDSILDNLRSLSKMRHRIVVRIPLVPGINDDDENIHQIGAFAAELPHLEQVDLLPYHHLAADKYERLSRDYAMGRVGDPSIERLAEIATILQGYGLQVEAGA